MANKILFIGVGGAGSIMADKAMKGYEPYLIMSYDLVNFCQTVCQGTGT